jgi:GT2 family glycosyltransferase
MHDKPLVSILLSSYKGRKLLEQFAHTIAWQDYPNFEVIVIVTEAQDGSEDWIRQNYPAWKLIHYPENVGISEDYNRGAKVAKGEILYTISNDMWFEPDGVSKMVAKMQSDPKIGVCTVKMRRITPELQKVNVIDSLGGTVDFMGFPDAIGINEEDRGQHDQLDEVFFSFGGAMMMRKDAFDGVGGYDPDAFALGDDIDLSWRIRMLGYRVVVEPKAVLWHRISATLGKLGRGQRRFWSERNTLRMILKNYSLGNLLWVLPVYTVCLLLELFFYLVVFRWDIGKRVLEAVMWNVRHWRATLEMRRFIQNARKVPDREILRLMRKRPWKLAMGFSFLRNPGSADWKNFFGRPAPSS